MALINATTLARVKDLMGEDSSAVASFDGVLNAKIASISAAIERYLLRPLAQESRTEVFSPRGFQTRLALLAAPVLANPAAIVKQASDRDFDAADAMDASEYFLDLDLGVIEFDEPLDDGNGTVQVVCTSGLAADTDGLIAAYPDIVEAATIWVKHSYDGKDFVGVASSGSGRTSQVRTTDAPPKEVQALLAPHRRLRLG